MQENSFTATTLSDGNHEIKIRAKDAVGNLSAFGTHNVLIDTIAPETPTPFLRLQLQIQNYLDLVRNI